MIQNLAVPAAHVRIQSSEQKELAGEDLLSEMSEVRWIITRDALREGWDCSFAYILALLDNTQARTTMTQMVGRVMRQPQAQTVDKSPMLNRCYAYCYNRDVGEVIDWVKQGLEKEGLTGIGHAVIGGAGAGLTLRTTRRRKPYRKLAIFLPQVLHRHGAGWRPLDYDRDILGALDWAGLDAGAAVALDDGEGIVERTSEVGLGGAMGTPEKWALDAGEGLTLDYFVRRLLDIVPNPWQAARIAGCL